MKKCACCEATKQDSDFYVKSKTNRLMAICKECHKAKMATDRESKREILAQKQKEYRKRKPDVCEAAANRWKLANRDKLREYYREYYRKNHKRQRQLINARMKKRLASDPSFKMRMAITRRILLALKAQGESKKCTAVQYLGCSIPDLKIWLESKFTKRMNWKNHGSYWHIDHVIPCASFDLSDHDQARACFHFRNLQPLPADENIRKSDKITNPQMSLMI